MLLTAGLVSTSFTVGKAIADGMDPAILTLIRFMIAALLFLPYIHWKYGLRLPEKKRLFGYACISFTLTGFFWLMFLSLQSTTALNTGVIFTLVPSISGLYSALLLKEKLGKFRILAMIPATVGAVWVLFHGSLEQLLAFNLNSGDLIFFEPDGNAHAFPVGFVPHETDALDLFVTDKLCNFFYQLGFIDLVGQFGDHNGLLAVFLVLFHLDFGPQGDNAPAGVIGFKNPLGAVNMAVGGKIRPRDILHQCPGIQVRIVDEGL